jgi:hypothetical protein
MANFGSGANHTGETRHPKSPFNRVPYKYYMVGNSSDRTRPT